MKKSAAVRSRRSFLKESLAAGVAFSIVPRHVLGGPGFLPPSEQLTRAIIGCGSISRVHLPMDYARLIAFCDVDATRLATRMKGREKEAKGYRDFREVLARPDIDVVHLCTPPHWHGPMAILAAQAGKDVWCEKPMTRTIGEGKKVVEAMERYHRVFRINTWFRFQANFYGSGVLARDLRKVVESGILGWPLRVTVSGVTGFDWKHNWCGKPNLAPQPVPAHLDYDMWLGPAPYKPYNADRVHGRFRGYWDYDGGGLGDMGQHFLDPIQYVMGKDGDSPVEIEADAPLQHPDAVGTWKRVTMRYADGCELILDGANQDREAALLEGPRGKVFKGFRSTIPDLRHKLKSLPDPTPQATDFGECVRTRSKFALNEVNGHRSCTLINLAKIAIRLGRRIRFDPVNQVIIDDPEAMRLVDQPMRAPWQV
ncbi:MAG TPA: oxidoreductase [Lentisphaeria bacterium]|nr:oxidoreductase [Lentisphaeria bacterium]